MRILLIIVVVFIGLCHFLLLDDVVETDPEIQTTFAMGDFIRGFGRPFIMIAVIGVAVGVAGGTPLGRRAAFAFLKGHPIDDVSAAHATRVFSATARAMVAAGALLAFTGALVLLGGHFTLRSTQSSPVTAADAIFLGLNAAITSLVLGRMVAGVLAEGSAAHARTAPPPAHAFTADLGLLVLLAVPTLITLAIMP